MSEKLPQGHRVRVMARIRHVGRGFTQGLIMDGDALWESCGDYGESALCRYSLVGNAEPAGRWAVPDHLFAEGICRVGGVLWQLTWKERVALRWDLATLTYDEVPYNRDGWGICSHGTNVYTSDGSSELVRRNPETLEPVEVIQVRAMGLRVRGLNDLAFSAGTVWANVAGTTVIAGIDPGSGTVTAVVDAARAAERFNDQDSIMNGIAALPAEREFLLTGKRWRWIRHVRLVQDRHPPRLDRLFGGWSH